MALPCDHGEAYFISAAAVDGHVRLGLDTGHLNGLSHLGRLSAQAPAPVAELKAERKHLRVAAGTLAATWFALRGCSVSLPIEPAEFDLLVRTPEGISRVQVKTTTFAQQNGWTVTVGHHPDTHSRSGQRKYVVGNARGLLGEVACSETRTPAGRAPASA